MTSKWHTGGVHITKHNVGLDFDRVYFMQDVAWSVENTWRMNSKMRELFENRVVLRLNRSGERVLVELYLSDPSGNVRNFWIDKVHSSVFSFRMRHYEQAIEHEVKQMIAVLEDSTIDLD